MTEEVKVVQRKSFGAVVKGLMETKGLTASEVARQTGMPQVTVVRIINGLTTNPSANTLLILAEFFNVSVDFLLDVHFKHESYEELPAPDYQPVHVPVLKWNLIKPWFFKKKKLLEECPEEIEWVPVHEKVSPDSFAIVTKKVSLKEVFDIGSTLIVDPGLDCEDGDFVLVSIRKNTPAVRQICQDGEDFYLNPIGLDIPPEKLEPPHIVLGVIIEYRMDV